MNRFSRLLIFSVSLCVMTLPAVADSSGPGGPEPVPPPTTTTVTTGSTTTTAISILLTLLGL